MNLEAFLEKRRLRKLRRKFEEFYAFSDATRATLSKEGAWRHFQALERLGPEKVRRLLEQGVFD